MGTLRVSFCLSCAVVVVAYGCSGESSVGAGAGAHQGAGASAGPGGSHLGDGGDAGAGGRGATSSAGRGGSSGVAGKGEGGAGGKKGVGGKAGAAGKRSDGGKGWAGGIQSEGGAGAGAGNGARCETRDDLNGNAGADCEREAVETCCTGPGPWPQSQDYYDVEGPACGEPRSCAAVLCVNDCMNDWMTSQHFELKCCEDQRWHFVRDGYQFERLGYTNADVNQVEQLSPPCGGAAIPSASALHFDGAGYLELGTGGTSRTPSFELWFRTTEPTGPLLSSTTTSHTLYLSAGRVCFYPDAELREVCTGEDAFADGGWHHAAVAVYDHDRYDPYFESIAFTALVVDGNVEPQVEIDDAAAVSSFTAARGRIGASATVSAFTGDLDEIRIWDEPRDRFQIVNYSSTRLTAPVVMPRLLGYWPLEESGSAAMTENLAVASCEHGPSGPGGCAGCDLANPYPDSGAAGAGGASSSPDGVLVDFDFATSPWLDGGAF